MIRTQLKSWLFAGSLCVAFSLPHLAHAAEPALPAPSTTPKSSSEGVKPVEPISLPPLPVPKLTLTEPKLAPLTSSRRTRNEVMVFGLRIPTLIAFGLGGLSAGGALATNLVARRGNDPASCDSCTDQNVKRGTLLVTSGVLTGLAAVGVGVGIAFMIKAPKDPTRDAIRPRFDVGLSGQKAVAKVGWAFTSF